MGVHVGKIEVTSTVAPAKLFKALVVDSDKLFPKILPEAFKSIEIIEGDGGAGSIRKIHFGDAEKYSFVKEKVHVLDAEKLEYHYSWIEGDALMNVFEKVDYEMKFKSHEGGSVVTVTTHFHLIGDIQMEEEKLKIGEGKVVGLFKAVEAYVLAHPDEY